MTLARNKSPGAERVRKHRERMKQKGMRLVQFWVPDVTTPEFAAEARRQSLLVARNAQEADDQAFFDSLRSDD